MLSHEVGIPRKLGEATHAAMSRQVVEAKVDNCGFALYTSCDDDREPFEHFIRAVSATASPIKRGQVLIYQSLSSVCNSCAACHYSNEGRVALVDTRENPGTPHDNASTDQHFLLDTGGPVVSTESTRD